MLNYTGQRCINNRYQRENHIKTFLFNPRKKNMLSPFNTEGICKMVISTGKESIV